MPQEVSRGHSTKKLGRTEQFVVFSLPEFNTDNSQNVLMRRVRTYFRGLLKIDDLSVCGKEEEILTKIRQRKYKPLPVRRVKTPKENGKMRNLGIPTVVDRGIQRAIVQVLSPIFEEQFSKSSYAFSQKVKWQ